MLGDVIPPETVLRGTVLRGTVLSEAVLGEAVLGEAVLFPNGRKVIGVGCGTACTPWMARTATIPVNELRENMTENTMMRLT